MNHQNIDRRSLMVHRIIADRLRARPVLSPQEVLQLKREFRESLAA